MVPRLLASLLSVVLFAVGVSCLHAQAGQSDWDQGAAVGATPGVLSQRAQADTINEILRGRLDNLLPKLMRECGIDMWLVINREYAEDPVYLTLVPEPVFAARRTTILMFHDRGAAGVERLTVSRYGLGDFYESAWEGGSADQQWQRLAELVVERDPKRIGVGTSEHWAFGDGLSSGLRDRLEQALGDHSSRLVSAEQLCIRWLETRSERELQIYPHVVQLARSAIAEAFSNRVITPGVTTTEEVRWWLRERFAQLGLPVWFQPHCNVQRRGDGTASDADFFGNSHTVIRRGDILHTDVGVRYLRMCTDTQEMGYVLRLGEEDVPKGLVDALARGNRWQDLLTGSFELGRTGNEILAQTRERSAQEDLLCCVYTHPLGFYGHSAGPTIGMWDNQGPTPVRGDWPLHANTCYAIEGNIKVQLPEWDDEWVQIKLEQDAVFDGRKVRYLGGRQTSWHVVR